MTSPRWRSQPLSRRALLQRLSALSAAAWALPHVSGAATREAWAQTTDTVDNPAGTTLERTIVTAGDGPYFQLTYGPGWPIEVRTELAEPRRGRENRRVALAAFLHVTDFQLVDAQSPARVEFVDRMVDPPSGFVPFGAAQRPQEALICQTVEALVQQARALSHAPVTGRRVDLTVSTGDNIDNKQANELRWFMTLMDGGDFAPNSGASDEFEGVQGFDAPEYYDPHYWHPESIGDPRAPDNYKSSYGYPDYPGLLPAAITPFTATGLTTPWYSVYGNHDALVQGNAPANPVFEEIATGNVKVLAPPPGIAPGDFYRGLVNQDPTVVSSISAAPARPVTADEERQFITGQEYIEAHLASPANPGPVGHGFTEDNLDPVTLYYVFEIAEGIRGITLDTTSPGSAEGSIGQTQLDWLAQQLVDVHSRHYDGSGNLVRTGNEDQLVVVVSHHRSASMQPIQGPDEQGNLERRYGGDEVLALLHRFPNVIAWVNGHSHFNRIVPHADPQGRTGGFWDITTAAQIDPPQQARMLEVVDNRDGTLSIFTTVVDHAAGPATEAGSYDVLGLASISRETSYNDFQANASGAIGQAPDRNTELLLAAPFRSGSEQSPPPERTEQPQDPGQSGGNARSLPATGGGLGAAAAGAGLAGMLALRRRKAAFDEDGSGPAG